MSMQAMGFNDRRKPWKVTRHFWFISLYFNTRKSAFRIKATPLNNNSTSMQIMPSPRAVFKTQNLVL